MVEHCRTYNFSYTTNNKIEKKPNVWGAENSRHGFGGTLSLSFFCLLLAFRRVLFNLFWREDLTGRREREE